MEVKGREKIVATSNLVAALFEHDTSRAQDPQVHLHAVVANVTQGPDGKWRALYNDKLWALNTLLNGIAMAGFRERVEALGYRVGEAGKHGNFEAAGIAREAVMAFSTRRQQILAKAAEIGAKSPQAMHAATLMTRPRKAAEPDRAAMHASWRESAIAAGLDLPELIAAADRNASVPVTPWDRLASAVGIVADRGRGLMAALGERLGLASKDPYLPRGVGQMSAPELAAAHAVASALRHLEQREAAFLRTNVFNADRAQVLGIDDGGVTIETSDGRTVVLAQGDPMLARLDLAYAMNAHMAQGQTADRGIAVLETRDAKLVNQQTFLVTVTRVRDALTLVVDRANGIERMLGRSPGGKTSAVEVAQSGAPATRGDQRELPEKTIDMEPGRVRPYEIGI